MLQWKRLLSLVLAFSMVFGMLPQWAAAAEDETAAPEAVSQAAAVIMAAENGITYTVDETAGTATVTGYTGSDLQLEIPAQLGGYPVRKIASKAFAKAIINALVLPEGLTSLGSDILDGNAGVKELTIPASVTSMSANSQGALRNSGVEKLIFAEGCTAVPAYAAQSAKVLTEVILPATVTSIGSAAFKYCSALTEIRLPAGLQKISSSAFASSGLTSLELPEGLETIANNILDGNTGVTELTIPASVTSMSTSSQGALRDSGVEKLIFGEGMTKIPAYAAQLATKLKQVVLPESLTTVGGNAFEGCTALAEIRLPASVTHINGGAFERCAAMTSIQLPAGLVEISSSVFASSGLTALELPEGLEKIGGSFLDGNTGVKELTIPASVTGMSTSSQGSLRGSGVEKLIFAEGRTAVPSYAAQTATKLTEVILPESLTAINGSAFEGCAALKEIKLPAGLKKISGGAFSRTGLTSLELPEGLESIGSSFLDGNTGVKELTIPASVTTMSTSSQGALRSSGVEKLIFAEGRTTIPGYAAQAATKLKQVVLPESLTTISSYAFGSCSSLTDIHLPAGLKKIGGGAFERCTALKTLNIPESVTSIGNGAFYNAVNLVLYCPYHSYAVMYAIENGIPYKPAGNFVDSDKYALSYAGSTYFADVKTVSAAGYVSMAVDYVIKDAWKGKVTDKVIHIFLPDGAELDEMTLKLDGKLCSKYTLKGRNLKIPVTEDRGSLRFVIQMQEQKGLVSYAAMSMVKDGTEAKEVIGILNDTVNVLTLHAPEVSASAEVPLSGIAPTSAQVTLSVNGTVAKTVTVSKAGNWSAAVTLPSPLDYHTYTVTASCAEGGETMEQTVAVTYHKGEPSVTGFAMTRGNQRWDLESDSKVKPKVVFNNKQIDFEVTFDDPSQINTVYVTSTRNQEVKYLEAKYDPAKKAFVTDGYFDPDNRGYVPGVLSIEYTKKLSPAPVSREFDWSIFDEELPDKQDAVKIVKDGTSGITTQIDMGSVSADLKDVFVEASVSVYDAATDGELSDWLGVFADLETVTSYVIPGVNDEKYIASLDTSDPYTYVMLVEDVTGSNFMKLTLKAAEDSIDDAEKLMKLGEISSTISSVNTVAGILLKQHEIETNMEQLRDEVMRLPHESDEALQEVLGKVDELEQDQTEFMLMTTVLPMIVSAISTSGVTAAGTAVTMAAAPVLMTAMIGVFVAVAPLFWQMRTAQIKGEKYRISFIIDPSGYVYDIATGARLAGVKTTAYHIPYDETPDFWDRIPAEGKYGTVWNAEEYDQANPLYTDEDGRYAWDVPEGWWRVKFEKDGYETTWSEWLPVPPPQTEVNIGMAPIGYEPPPTEETKPTEPEETKPTDPVYENPFEDVFEADYYYDPVLWAVNEGITNGMGATHFAPEGTCTRAQIVTFLWRANGSPASGGTNPFTDVPADAWYTDAVLWAVENGITTGTSATTFSPDAGCTRGQVATFLWRSQGQPAVSGENIFTDIAPGAYYYDAVLWAVANGITNGMGEGIFAPDATCTRGQIVTFLYRAMA